MELNQTCRLPIETFSFLKDKKTRFAKTFLGNKKYLILSSSCLFTSSFSFSSAAFSRLIFCSSAMSAAVSSSESSSESSEFASSESSIGSSASRLAVWIGWCSSLDFFAVLELVMLKKQKKFVFNYKMWSKMDTNRQVFWSLDWPSYLTCFDFEILM